MSAAKPARTKLSRLGFLPGQPLVYWVERLWRVIVATPASRNPEVQLGENCSLTPTDSPVSFVYGFQAAPSERTCYVPKGKTVVFPVWGLLNDYPCPDPSFQPTGQQTLETFLRLGARQFDDATKNLVVTVDGQRVDYTQHRLTTSFFSFKGDASLQQSFGACITGSWQTAVADGWYLVYPSWQTGQQHTISVTAIAPSGAHDSLIYHLVIDP